MHEGARISTALAVAALVAVSSLHLAAGRLLRYATLSPTDSAGRAALTFALVAAGAVMHEIAVRGVLYRALRARMTPGLAAPVVALVGAVAPAAVRLLVLPRPPAPFAVVAAQAYLVEALLGLGLAWIALARSDERSAAAQTWPCAAALALVFAVRLFVVPVFHGGVVPLLELAAALLASLSVAAILSRPLAPHRAAVMESA